MNHLLHHYERELRYLRQLGREISLAHPDLGGHLGLGPAELKNPDTERLVEACALLAARVQCEIDAQYPRLTEQLLGLVAPAATAPLPSMTLLALRPRAPKILPPAGLRLPRGLRAFGQAGAAERAVRCEYRTTQAVWVGPLRLSGASAGDGRGAASGLSASLAREVQSAIALELTATHGGPLGDLSLGDLPVYVTGRSTPAGRLLPLLCFDTLAVVVEWQGRRRRVAVKVAPHGLDECQAILPDDVDATAGERVMREYLALPERTAMLRLEGLQQALGPCPVATARVVFLLGRREAGLEQSLRAEDFELFCSPAVNLFERRCDRIPIEPDDEEVPLVAQRDRPFELEVHEVLRVVGHCPARGRREVIAPHHAGAGEGASGARYLVRRRPRLPAATASAEERSYPGTQVFLGVAPPALGGDEAPEPGAIRSGFPFRQLAVVARCSNRHGPLVLAREAEPRWAVDDAQVDPCCLVAPTAPRGARGERGRAWALLEHLRANQLDPFQGPRELAKELRQALRAIADHEGASLQPLLGSLTSVTAVPRVRRAPAGLPMPCAVGIELVVECDLERGLGAGAYGFGLALSRFLQRYVRLGSFLDTTLQQRGGGRAMTWRGQP